MKAGRELDVMEKILQCKHVTAISSEKALELIAEVRRLNETNGQLKHQETYRDNNVIVAQLDTIKKERKFREKQYDEIRGLKERNAQITQNYNKRVEKYYYLQQEIKRLNDDLESWQGLAHDRLKNWCMFFDRSSKLEKENKRYKKALQKSEEALKEVLSWHGHNLQVANWHMNDEYEPLDEFIDNVGAEETLAIILKALEVDTNEN